MSFVATCVALLRRAANMQRRDGNTPERNPDDPELLLEVARTYLAEGQPRQAYEALDRLLNNDRRNNVAWDQLLTLLRNADAELAYWIGLKARSSERVDVMAAAMRALLPLQGPGHRILEILPVLSWGEEIRQSYWDALGALLDPTRPGALVVVAMQVGQFADAEQLLRLLVSTLCAIEPRLALTMLLEERSQFAEAATFATQTIAHWPERYEARLALARIQQKLGQFDKAIKTFQDLLSIAPDNASIWLEYARLADSTYDIPFETANLAYERAAKLGGDDPVLLELVARHFLYQHEFSRASAHYENLMARHPGTRVSVATCVDYARCLRECGRLQEADEVTAAGLSHARSHADRCNEDEDWEMAKSQEALLLLQAGREQEATEVLTSIRDHAEPAGPNYARPEYLPRTPQRLQRLKETIGGRDTIILLHGPSFADFAARMDKINDVDVATATLNSFAPVDEEVRRHLGRGIDVLLLSHPTSVRGFYHELQTFLCRRTPNLLLTTSYALSGLSDLGSDENEFVTRHDDRLLFSYPTGGPPVPSRPMHFQAGHSVSLLLPLIVMARPRRIFLVGADGGGHPRHNRPYFFYNDIDKESSEQDFLQRHELFPYHGLPDRLAETNRRFRIAALDHDRLLVTAFLFLNRVFDLPIPPIFNVCPHSAHQAFPRIDCETAVAMLRNQLA